MKNNYVVTPKNIVDCVDDEKVAQLIIAIMKKRDANAQESIDTSRAQIVSGNLNAVEVLKAQNDIRDNKAAAKKAKDVISNMCSVINCVGSGAEKYRDEMVRNAVSTIENEVVLAMSEDDFYRYYRCAIGVFEVSCLAILDSFIGPADTASFDQVSELRDKIAEQEAIIMHLRECAKNPPSQEDFLRACSDNHERCVVVHGNCDECATGCTQLAIAEC